MVLTRDPKQVDDDGFAGRMSDDDVANYFDWWQSLSPLERLFAEE